MLNIETAKKSKDQIKVRGTVIHDFEMSRVSQSYTKTTKLPESCKNSLKSEAQRKVDLQKIVKAQQKERDGLNEYFDYKNDQIETILGTIEKIQIHKLAGLEALDKGKRRDVKGSQIQKRLDLARDENRRIYMKNKRATVASQKQGAPSLLLSRDSIESLDAYFGRHNSIAKNRTKMMSQSTDTFDDIQQKLINFHAQGGQSYHEQTPSRFMRQEARDVKPQAVEVGKYYPRFKEIDKSVTSLSFAGNRNFLSTDQRQKRVDEFRENTSQLEFKKLSPSKQKKKILAFQSLLKVPVKEDPFKPSSYYHERKTLTAIGSTINCGHCIKRGTPFVFEPPHAIEKRQVDSKYNCRLDAHILEFGKRAGHQSMINEGSNPHESRFDLQQTSSLCGGEVLPANYTSTSLMKAPSTKSSLSPVAYRSYQARSFGSKSKYTQSAETLKQQKRPAVANQPNIPSIYFERYASRKPESLFSIPGQTPLASETGGHGGVFYNRTSYDKVNFSRSISSVNSFGSKPGPSKAERISRIESIVKRTKAPSSNMTTKKRLVGKLAQENAQILFEAINPKRVENHARKTVSVFQRLTAIKVKSDHDSVQGS